MLIELEGNKLQGIELRLHNTHIDTHQSSSLTRVYKECNGSCINIYHTAGIYNGIANFKFTSGIKKEINNFQYNRYEYEESFILYSKLSKYYQRPEMVRET